jgi:hypothetical protein
VRFYDTQHVPIYQHYFTYSVCGGWYTIWERAFCKSFSKYLYQENVSSVFSRVAECKYCCVTVVLSGLKWVSVYNPGQFSTLLLFYFFQDILQTNKKVSSKNWYDGRVEGPVLFVFFCFFLLKPVGWRSRRQSAWTIIILNFVILAMLKFGS